MGKNWPTLEELIQKRCQQKVEEFPTLEDIIQQEQREFGDIIGRYHPNLYPNYSRRRKRQPRIF